MSTQVQFNANEVNNQLIRTYIGAIIRTLITITWNTSFSFFTKHVIATAGEIGGFAVNAEHVILAS